MTDYIFDPTAYAEGATIPSSGVVGNTLIQITRGTGATVTALDAAGTLGARGVRFSTPTGQQCFAQFGPNPEAGEVSDTVAQGFRWKVPASPPSSNIIIGGIRGGTGSTSMGLFMYTTAGKFALGNRNGSVVHTFTTTPTPGTWYWCTVGAQRGTTGTAPASTNGLINGAFYVLSTSTIVDTAAALTAQDTGQVASRYARLGGSMVAVTLTTTPYINDAGYSIFRTGSAAIIPPPSTNSAPTAGISSDKTVVDPNEQATLTLSESDDVAVTTRTFRQVSGPTAVVTGSGLSRTITAPTTLSGGTMVFGYKTGDAGGLESAEATVNITLRATTRRYVTVGGSSPAFDPVLRKVIT